MDLVNYNQEKNLVNLQAECSKGTYVRSLVKDIAKKLGTVATVSQLRRISSGNFRIEQALKLEEVEKEKIILFQELVDKYKIM